MPRNEKYYFEYIGYDSGTHNFETIMKGQYKAPRWTAFIEPVSFSSAGLKKGTQDFIIKGHLEDDSPYPRKFWFYVTEDLSVCAGNTSKIWTEGEDNFPLPKYVCDFTRGLVRHLKRFEEAPQNNTIKIGTKIIT